MISFDRFKKHVRLHIAEYLPRDIFQGWHLKEMQVCSINRVVHTFQLHPPKGMRFKALPSFHFQTMYERQLLGESLEDTMRHIARLLEFYSPYLPEDRDEDADEEDFIREEDLQVVLINRARNKTLLKHTPHRDFLDLAAIAVSVRPDDGEDGFGMCIASEEIAADLGLTAEELLEKACENTFSRFPPKLIYDDFSIFAGCGGAFSGAACLLDKDMLQKAADKFGCDLLILPDSLHGVIIRGYDCEEGECAMTEAFRRVQALTTDYEDYLSDTPYVYERKTSRLRLCGDYFEDDWEDDSGEIAEEEGPAA